VRDLLGPFWTEMSHPSTRQISAENPTGVRGGGSRTNPDGQDISLPLISPASELGAGFKVKPYIQLEAGASVDIADIAGPAVITGFFITSNISDLNLLRLQCFWDHDPLPAVDVPVGAFFGTGHSIQNYDLFSYPVSVAPANGCTSYWSMPFDTHGRMKITNNSNKLVEIIAYRVTFEVGQELKKLPKFFARYSSTQCSIDTPIHKILDNLSSGGFYVGTTLFWTTHRKSWWGEGQIKFFLDGDHEFPSLVEAGTEDYFGGAWAFGKDAIHSRPSELFENEFCAPFFGAPFIQTDENNSRRVSMYRWHIPDPIYFNKDLRIEVQSLGWGSNKKYMIRDDLVSSVAYWYQY